MSDQDSSDVSGGEDYMVDGMYPAFQMNVDDFLN